MNTPAERRTFFRESARRFADHYLAYVQSHALDFSALDDELQNLFRALVTYSHVQAWREVAHLVRAMDVFLDTRGYWSELRFWLERVLDHADAIDDPAVRMEIIESLAGVSSSQGERSKAIALYQEVIRLAEQQNDDGHLARAYYGLGTVYFSLGRWKSARSCWEKALSPAERIDDQALTSVICYFLGSPQLLDADSGNAPGRMDLAIRLAARIAPRLGLIGKSLLAQIRGMTCLVRGQYGRARQHYLEALELARGEGDRRGEALALYQLGQIAHWESDLSAALDYYHQSEDIARELGDYTGLMALYSTIGLAHLQQQRFDLARLYLERSVALEREAGSPEGLAEGLYWLGHALANTGDLEQARQVLEESLAIFARLNSPRSRDVREALSLLRAAMDRRNDRADRS